MKNQKSMPLYSKVAWYGVMISLALIVSYVELLIPFHFGIPGIKLGLANIIVICMLYSLGFRAAFLISFVRIILSGILFGNLFSMLYSMAGGMLSLLVMAFSKKQFRFFDVMGISILGGVFHNIGQMVVAVIVVENLKIAFYLPVLIAAGTITGMLIGLLGKEILKRMDSINQIR